MLLTIQRTNGTYFHNKGRIILFETEREANQFIEKFTQYAVNRLMHEQRSQEAMNAPIVILSESNITPVDFDIRSVRCGVVYAKELMRKR